MHTNVPPGKYHEDVQEDEMNPTRQNRFDPRLLMLLLFPAATALGDDWNTVLDLRGEWKFQTGDKMEWADPRLNDQKWETIFVPSAWEDEGFPGYDGYAWYRKSFTLPQTAADGTVYLHLGYVDDVCEVFLNGTMIGFSGSFPPDYETAYDTYQQYCLPIGILKKTGTNVIAVRVYDSQLSGGILRGKIGLYQSKKALKPDVPLPGIWEFRTGDNTAWKGTSVDESGWRDAYVPAYWETIGLRNYDGFGWYRVKFRVPESLRGKQLVLLLGKIDDIDEAYLNGERIGRTGSMGSQRELPDFNEEYREQRAYTIPRDLLVAGENTLAVRVYDGFRHGGIYDGPIGIVTRDRYRQWREPDLKEWNPFDFFR
jgi:sialate O-acetylesterase